MMKAKGILKTLLDELLLVLFFMGNGNAIGERLGLINVSSSLLFSLTFSYFLGMLVAFVLVRFLDVILKNLKISYWLTVIFIAYMCIIKGGFQNIWKLMGELNWKIGVGIFCTSVLLALITGIENYSFFPIEDNEFLKDERLSVFSSLGTLHTVRSANIAITAVNENRIPMIGINYGPMMILTFFKFLKNPFLYFANYIFTVGNNMIMFFFLIGMFQEFFSFSFGLALFAALVVCWGGEGVGLRYKLSTDGASCTYWGLSSTYPDVLAGFSCFLTWIYQLFLLSQGKVSLMSLVFYSIICVLIWCIIAPQLYVLVVGISCGNIVILPFLRISEIFTYEFILIFFVLIASGICAIYFGGGMFNHSDGIRRDIMGAEPGGGLVIGNFGVVLSDLSLLKQGIAEYDIISRNVKKIGQALFYPLLSVILMLIIWLQGSASNEYIFWGTEILFLILGGLIIEISFSNQQCTGKRELTRFLTPALVISRIMYMLTWANYIADAGKDWISIAGMVIAISMVVFELPFHIIFIQKACSVKLYELFPLWFQETAIVCSMGKYAGDSELNRWKVQNISVKLDEICDQKVYIYGTGKVACQQLAKFRQSGIYVAGFIDSNPKKWKQNLEGLQIYSPYEISKKQDENTTVVIGSGITGQIISIYYVCQLYRINNAVYVADVSSTHNVESA